MFTTQQMLLSCTERLERVEEADEAEQDELEAMFKPKRKGRPDRAHAEKKATVENFLVWMAMAVAAHRLLCHASHC